MALQFDKLTLSMQQPVMPNDDPADNSERVFWSDGLVLLNWSGALYEQLKQLDTENEAEFWKGSIPDELRDFHPQIWTQYPPEQILDYCKAWKSHSNAFIVLSTKARGEKLSNKSDHKAGRLLIDHKSYALSQAARLKSVTARGVPQAIRHAVEQNDVRFFIRLGKVLEKKERPPEVDWSKVDPTACFLWNNWCQPTDYAHWLPALCFFTDQALADFCSAAFGRKPGTPSMEAVRKCRRRLGLKTVRTPKIRCVTLRRGELLFA